MILLWQSLMRAAWPWAEFAGQEHSHAQRIRSEMIVRRRGEILCKWKSQTVKHLPAPGLDLAKSDGSGAQGNSFSRASVQFFRKLWDRAFHVTVCAMDSRLLSH